MRWVLVSHRELRRGGGHNARRHSLAGLALRRGNADRRKAVLTMCMQLIRDFMI